jgi:hypothetical protein
MAMLFVVVGYGFVLIIRIAGLELKSISRNFMHIQHVFIFSIINSYHSQYKVYFFRYCAVNVQRYVTPIGLLMQ